MNPVRLFLMTVLLGTTAAGGCASPTEPSDPTTAVLAPGEAVTHGALTARFVGVTADSRCPANALCIQQGDAFFTVEARVRNAAATSYQLQVNDPARRRVVHAGYSIEVEELAPYPFTITTINPIPPGDYRLTLTIDHE